jgi:hypothetical protein
MLAVAAARHIFREPREEPVVLAAAGKETLRDQVAATAL